MRKLCYLFEHVKLCMRNMPTTSVMGGEKYRQKGCYQGKYRDCSEKIRVLDDKTKRKQKKNEDAVDS